MIAAAALLALAGPAAAVCKGAPQAPAADFFADENAHRTLRAEIGVPMPTAPEHITIYAIGGLTGYTITNSIVATRGADSRWHTDQVTRVRSKDVNLPARRPDTTRRILSAALSARLDALLAMRAFWRESARHKAKLFIPPMHPTERTIDIVTPTCSRRSSFSTGETPPLMAEVIKIVAPD